MSDSPVSPNGLLASLSPADFELLRPHLEPVEFKNEAVLYAAGDKIDRVYFPHSGIISLVPPSGSRDSGLREGTEVV
jgi:CRP-like cAMP-binding protein